MSRVGPKGRSFAKLRIKDLLRLAEIASDDRKHFFLKHPDWAKLYRRRVLCTALCQGAASHFVHGRTGINDFDVYTFYASHPKRHWYAKRRRVRDFGDPQFGCSVDKPSFVGRRVDLMGRDIPAVPGEDPERALQRYLENGRTATARFLAEKAVVLLDPPRRAGKVVWDSGYGAV